MKPNIYKMINKNYLQILDNDKLSFLCTTENGLAKLENLFIKNNLVWYAKNKPILKNEIINICKLQKDKELPLWFNVEHKKVWASYCMEYGFKFTKY